MSDRSLTGRSAARTARAALCAALSAALVLAAHLGCAGESRAVAPTPPNILLIVTDDQPTGMVKRMPALDRAPGFVRFNSYYDNNPLCCPTRSTLLTGLYSHHTGVETNLVAQRFDDSSTLATWLDDAGYETGLFGKYLNEYPWGRGAGYVPPGWDAWSAFTPDAAYYDYTLVGDDGSRRHFGHSRADYSTDVLADRADEFISRAVEAHAPFFAYFAPYGPHAPRTPAPRDRHAFTHAAVKLPENFNRVAEDAPRWWARRPKLDPGEQREATREQWRTLQSVDDAIGRFIETLKRTGAYEDTVIVFLSDNGYSLGSHRNPWKDCAYEECIHLPLMIRWPGHAGANIDALAGSMDIAPTIAELAGVTPDRPVDGQSLVPLLSGAESSLDRPVLLRHVRYPHVAPSFWGLRTERWTYVRYGRSGERELYDDRADPRQLRNLAGNRRYDDVVAELEATLDRLRSG